ncbi:Mediator of RNA polymerase II transcription subunit 33B [Linum perenne]
MAESVQTVWDSVRQLTKSAQDKNADPLQWTIQLSSCLAPAGVDFPSDDLARFLVSHICFDNHVPTAWKFLEKALAVNIVPPMLVLALLSASCFVQNPRVIPNRKLHPAAYRLYLELVKRHSFAFSSEFGRSICPTIMDSVDDVLHLSDEFGLRVNEPGVLLVQFVFSVVWQLLDATLEDEGLLELTLEKKSRWFTVGQDMEIDGFVGERNEVSDGLMKGNTSMATELIGEFLRNRFTSRILHLACANMPSHWKSFAQGLHILLAHSAALRSSKLSSPKDLEQLLSKMTIPFHRFFKTKLHLDCHALISSTSIKSSAGQWHGTSQSELWLPIDMFLEDCMDGSPLVVVCAIQSLIGLVKALRALNGCTWHDTFLGLWTAALRLVQRGRDSCEGPVPRLDTCLCLLLSITTHVVIEIIEDEESELGDDTACQLTAQSKEKQGSGTCREGLTTALQSLGDYEGLLTPPQSIISMANQAAAKAAVSVAGLAANNGCYENVSLNDMPTDCPGNLRHLIVEACIARNVLDTSAYLWPGYVGVSTNQVPTQLPGWSSLMKGLPMTPAMISILVATPASCLLEVEKIFEIAVNGSSDEKISAANILCGASLVRGWNVQEHTIPFIIKLLSPFVPADYSGSVSHLFDHATLFYVLLLRMSSADSLQILSLHGMAPLLAGALMPICEVFGSSAPDTTWTLPTGEEISCHDVFSCAFSLLVRLWRFHFPPSEQVMGDVTSVGLQLSPEYLLMVRNTRLAAFAKSPRDTIRRKRFSQKLKISMDPIFLDSFPKFKIWYRHHLECISCVFSGLLPGNPVHQIVDALLTIMFRKINRNSEASTATPSGSSNSPGPSAEEALTKLKVPAWDILEATPFALDAALTACGHGKLSPRDLATGLKDLADFLPATLATIASFFSAEVTRGVWKPACMNGSDWPSPAANLASVEQQIKNILAATGVDVPSLAIDNSLAGSSHESLPLPLAALVSLTITYKLEEASDRFLTMIAPALTTLATGCPWPCMPIISALWIQKAKRLSDFLVFHASQTVFHHNSDAVVQLLRSCFTSTLSMAPTHISSSSGVGSLLGHGFGSHSSGTSSPVAPGILYIKVHQAIRDVMFMTEQILSLLMDSVTEIATNGLTRDAAEKLRKTKHRMRYGQLSIANAMRRVKLAASLGASLVWITGGPNLVQSLIKETMPSWFISKHNSDHQQVGSEMVATLGGYGLAYFTLMCGTFAWGVDSTSAASRRRPKVLSAHLDFLASALDGKVSLGCDWKTARVYVTVFAGLMVACTPKWVEEVELDTLKRLSKGLRRYCNETELAMSLLGCGGVAAMGAAAELVVDCGLFD